MSAPRSLTTLTEREQVRRTTRGVLRPASKAARGPPPAKAWLLSSWSPWVGRCGVPASDAPRSSTQAAGRCDGNFGPPRSALSCRRIILATTWRDCLTTIGFASDSAPRLALLIGLVGGIAVSETWWRRESTRHSSRRRTGWLAHRALWGLPATWSARGRVGALLGQSFLGAIRWSASSPLPYPSVRSRRRCTRRLIDEAAGGAYRALRAAGPGESPRWPMACFLWHVVISSRMRFYRLECSYAVRGHPRHDRRKGAWLPAVAQLPGACLS